MERLKAIKEQLINCVESQLGKNLAEVDAEELGEVVDMIKDMDEAMYYCSVVKAMEESKEEKKIMDKIKEYMPQNQPQRYYGGERMPYYHMEPDYRDMDRDYGRMYYSGGGRSGGNSGGMSGGMGSSSNSSSSGGSRNYSDYNYPMEIRDVREGRSPMSRKNYMESKELHRGTPDQMKELEKYMKELTDDIVEMIEDASPEEKAMLSQKLSTLASKVK